MKKFKEYFLLGNYLEDFEYLEIAASVNGKPSPSGLFGASALAAPRNQLMASPCDRDKVSGCSDFSDYSAHSWPPLMYYNQLARFPSLRKYTQSRSYQRSWRLDVDITLPQPKSAPPNCSFAIADAEGHWSWATEPFDLIYGSIFVNSIHDWP